MKTLTARIDHPDYFGFADFDNLADAYRYFNNAAAAIYGNGTTVIVSGTYAIAYGGDASRGGTAIGRVVYNKPWFSVTGDRVQTRFTETGDVKTLPA